MGRWTPLILMAGGLAILLGTLLGINFPMGEQRTASNTPTGRKSQVLPANINVNSSAPGRNRGNNTANEGRNGVAQENLGTTEERNSDTAQENRTFNEGTTSESRTSEGRTSVAQNNTPNNDSFENTPESTTRDVQSTDTSSDNNQGNEPIRALW